MDTHTSGSGMSRLFPTENSSLTTSQAIYLRNSPAHPLLEKSPGAERLRQSEPKLLTTLNTTQTSGAPDQGNREKSISVSSDAASSRSLLTDINGAQAHLALGKSQPKSNTDRATRVLESSSAIANRNPHPQKNLYSDTTSPLTRWQRPNWFKLQHRIIGLHPASQPTHTS